MNIVDIQKPGADFRRIKESTSTRKNEAIVNRSNEMIMKTID